MEGLGATTGAAGLARAFGGATGLVGFTGTAFLATGALDMAVLLGAVLDTGFATGLLAVAGAAGWTRTFAAGLATVFLFAATLGAGLTAALLTTAGFFAWDARPFTAVGAALVVFAVRVAGAFTRGLLSVPDEACSGGGTPRPLVTAASDVVGDADPLVVIPRLPAASGVRPARRLTAGLAGRGASGLGGDCNEAASVLTDTRPDGKPRRWRSETKSTAGLLFEVGS